MTDWTDLLIGRSIPTVTEDSLILDDGTRIKFDEADDCCSYAIVDKLRTCKNIITSVRIIDEGDSDYEENLRAEVVVLTDAGEINIVEQSGSEGTGYYLHGWSLRVTVIPPEK